MSQLSGGSKAHWLSRSFSEALLVPSSQGTSADVVIIVDRLLKVLEAARQSLANAVEAPGDPPPPPRPRFAFIDNGALRSSLDQAYRDAQDALANGDFALAVTTLSSILETIITYAIERRRDGDAPRASAPPARSSTGPSRSGLPSRSVRASSRADAQGCRRSRACTGISRPQKATHSCRRVGARRQASRATSSTSFFAPAPAVSCSPPDVGRSSDPPQSRSTPALRIAMPRSGLGERSAKTQPILDTTVARG